MYVFLGIGRNVAGVASRKLVLLCPGGGNRSDCESFKGRGDKVKVVASHLNFR